MSRNSVNIDSESDDENTRIEPSDLIDTQENKPKISESDNIRDDLTANQKQVYKKIELKQVSKLTDDEKSYLIDLYKNGGEDDNYKVYFYRNGTNKIVRKKQPPKYNTTKRLLENQKPSMTTEQILMEHVIDLEAKYATLYQKHKKLKKSYKTLHEDIYCDSDEALHEAFHEMPNEVAQQAEGQQPIPKEAEQQPHEMPNEIAQQAREMPNEVAHEMPVHVQNGYINKLRKPQKGYRKMMESKVWY